MIKKVLVYLTIITFVLFGIGIVFNKAMIFKTKAADTSCPKNYTDAQCLTYLLEQSQKLKNEKSNLSGKLSQENYNQLSLNEKINYIDSQILSSENQIKQLELQIETKNVEVRILGRDILELQNNINTISQEVSKLDSAIEKRMSFTYKYSFITPMEIFLESSNFDTLLRRFKYLSETRKKDATLLDKLSVEGNKLKQEEIVLANKRNDVEIKRSEIEDTKTQLFDEKESLTKQRSEKSYLLALSEKREQEYRIALDKNRKQQSKLDSAIIEYIAKNSGKAVYGGNVTKGQAIGTMGNTGLSYGAHLHFSISTTKQIGSGNVNPWAGYLKKGPDYWQKSSDWTYYYLKSQGYQLPVVGDVVLTQGFHQGYAIDMVSLLGEGATVVAANSGKVYSGKDQYGGKYVYIDHADGKRTTYLHLKSVFVVK